MQYVSEEVSASFASHEMAFDAVKTALIATSESASIFPVVLGHGSDLANTYAIRSSAETG